MGFVRRNETIVSCSVATGRRYICNYCELWVTVATGRMEYCQRNIVGLSRNIVGLSCISNELVKGVIRWKA